MQYLALCPVTASVQCSTNSACNVTVIQCSLLLGDKLLAQGTYPSLLPEHLTSVVGYLSCG